MNPKKLFNLSAAIWQGEVEEGIMKIQRRILCILFSLIPLAVMCWHFQNVSGATVVKADVPVENTSARTAEAEKCALGQEEGCRTDGSWKHWSNPGFSNGQLITNEPPIPLGSSLPATLTLEFTGTGVAVVYRQDTWYGKLGVKIDDQSEYCINQRGTIKNQAEACFEVNGPDPHTLTLTGGEATGVITGVITIDAIKVFTNGQPCGTEENLCNRGIIIPAYFYPDLPDGYWGQLVEAAKKIGGRLIVIANVYNGPGTVPDPKYTEAINAVVSNGGKVIGYVHTCYGNQTEPDPTNPLCPRTIEEIKSDVDRWYQFYPTIDGIFFDTVSGMQDKVVFYQGLYNYVQGKRSAAIVVNNFGVTPHEDYLSIGSSILCTFEGPFSLFVGWKPPSWIPRERSCALVYDTSSDNLTQALEYLSKENVGWFYFISDTLPNPWDTLPIYFPGLVNKIAWCVYLPLVISKSP